MAERDVIRELLDLNSGGAMRARPERPTRGMVRGYAGQQERGYPASMSGETLEDPRIQAMQALGGPPGKDRYGMKDRYGTDVPEENTDEDLINKVREGMGGMKEAPPMPQSDRQRMYEEQTGRTDRVPDDWEPK